MCWGGEGPNGEEGVTITDLDGARHQMSTQLELLLEDRGEAPNVQRSGEARSAVGGDERSGVVHEQLMALVVDNLNSSNRRMRTRMSGGVGGE